MTQSSTSQQSSQTSAPWSVQQPYLTQAFGQASTNLNNANGTAYTGPQVAQFNPDQLATFQKMIQFGGNTSGAETSGAVGANTANAGYGALTDAFSGLKGFTPGGGTQSNIDAATAYANNPATDGMIDAAMRDARRSVSEQALPGIARGSAGTGNTMSSRRAISEGLVERGLADKTADVSSNIRGQQFDNGLKLAEQNSEASNNSILDAFKSMASAGGSAIGTGINGIGAGIDQFKGLFDIANGGGAGQQASGQAAIDNAKGMSEYGTDTASKNLQNFYNIIGSQNWGGTSSGTQNATSTPSTWNTVGSGLGVLSSLFKLSDRRMKKDIEMIGHAPNGLPVYLYRYIGDDNAEREVGLMAQDVEKVRPEAVKTIGGLKHVNYETALA
jgi:hypothetical protein